jgi:hypothetical protein
MNVPKDHSYDADILETLSQRVGDGADAVVTKYVRLQSG